MRRLFFIFLILLFALWIGYLIHQDSGYVLISYSDWAIEMSLWVSIILISLAFILFYFLIRLFRHTTRLGSKFQHWGNTRKGKKAKQLTDVGLCDLAEGNWQSAETSLAKAAKNSHSPLIHYLAAARAAHEQQAFDRRDTYLQQAHKSTKGSEVPVSLTQAQLQIDGKQWEHALATLKHIRQLAPNHKYALKLLNQVYLELKDWQQLQLLLPDLKKYNVLKSTDLQNLEKIVYMALIKKAAKDHSLDVLNKIWHDIPKILRTDSQLIHRVAAEFILLGDDAQAATLIESVLKKEWDSMLAELYGRTNTNTSKQLNNAEAWLKKHPKDPKLLLCLGRLCIREQLWGKAQHYLEQSLEQEANPQAYHALGEVMEAIGQSSEAKEHYRSGLKLTESS